MIMVVRLSVTILEEEGRGWGIGFSEFVAMVGFVKYLRCMCACTYIIYTSNLMARRGASSKRPYNVIQRLSTKFNPGRDNVLK